MIKPKSDMLLEISWEVCNKVGGIWTVISSKAAQIRKYYSDNYICIGPYFADKTPGNFDEEPIPEELKSVHKELHNIGIVFHYGTWLIKSEPKAILIDYTNFRYKINEIKKDLWDNFKVDSINSGSSDYDEPLVWATAAGALIERLSKVYDKKIVAQFHEWLAGPGLLYLKARNVSVATVFTTHATVVGRSIAAANVDIFGKAPGSNKCIIESLDIDAKAYEYHVEGKHFVEKQSAQNADVFTTVSEITALEATAVVKRKPEVVLPNGLDNDLFPTFEEESILHRKERENIREFTMFYFFPYYQFDIKDTLFFFLAGRYEFRNKGIDTYIHSLAKLNQMLKKEKSNRTIVAFIFVPGGIRGVRQDIIENRAYFIDVRDSLKNEMSDIYNNILYTITSKGKLFDKNIFTDSFMSEVKIKLLRFFRKGSPPLVTHNLQDGNDAIINTLYAVGLDNKEEQRVKVIFYPTYLSGADGLLDLNYYESMQGCHLGVFPSLYEPWGYTPLEAAALGVSSVTTDLAGFGKYILQTKTQKEHPGIFVLRRMDRNDDEIIKDLADFMYMFATFSKQDRVQNKIEAKRLASIADWNNLILNYLEAHNMALDRRLK